MEPLAKPSGITYKDHRQHVHDEAKELLQSHGFWNSKYERLTGQILPEQVLKAAWWHDEGKKNPKWSKACQLDYELYRAWRQTNGLPSTEADANQNAKDFKRYESKMKQLKQSTGPHLMKVHLRHEFDSLKKAIERFGKVGEDGLTLAVMVAIAAHHGKLSRRHEDRWLNDGKEKDKVGPYADLWAYLNNESKTLIDAERGEWEKKVRERYKIAAVRALIHLADTRASRRESGGEVPEIKPFSYQCPYTDTGKRGVQKTAEKMGLNPKVGILRAPTGSGKTHAALLWAQGQINNGFADRLVIAMPTRFTSNALSVNVGENIDSTGLYHSSAMHNRMREAENKNQKLSETQRYAIKDEVRELQKLAQYLATPATVCTIDHLLISLTGTKEDHHTTFFFLANSAVVFDEADFYDPFIQANLLILLDTLRVLEVPVLIMSATVPDSSKEMYSVDKIEDVAAEVNNSRRSIVWRGQAEKPEDVEGVLKGIVRQRTGIVYANTIDRAYAYYEWFSNEHKKGGPKPILYHSRFTEDDKGIIEKELIDALGKEAWLNADKQTEGVAILTQIGEMSVNISAPIMLSDACPWDRLAQRAGRLDRFGLSPNGGILYVVEPLKGGEIYPAPYGEPQKGNGWVPVPAFTKTLEELKELFDEVPQYVTPQNFVDWVNKLYPTNVEFGSDIKVNRDELKKMMKANWLIIQGQFTDEEEGKAGQWKSRNIPPQQTVFVGLPEMGKYEGNDKSVYPFSNWDEFRSYQLEFGISCPTYLVEKAKKLNQIMSFHYKIGDDKKKDTLTLWLAAPDIYNSKTGLATFGKGEQTGRANGVID